MAEYQLPEGWVLDDTMSSTSWIVDDGEGDLIMIGKTSTQPKRGLVMVRYAQRLTGRGSVDKPHVWHFFNSIEEAVAVMSARYLLGVAEELLVK